ncbi:MAG TPA: hypothetical protein VMS94_00675 [Acidobacteriota bacterium]|nr:hypothetical protein [Acidobacteriota bacterium]
MQDISPESIRQIATEYIRKKKDTDRIDISTVEQKNGCWVIRGTCPIDLEGHPWAEKFEVVIDVKGKVRSEDFSLL